MHRGAARAPVALLAAAVLVAPVAAAPPYRDLRSRTLDYHGPGREEAAPEGLTEVRIGWFGPADVDDPAGGDFWAGALLAVEDANAAGGVGGLPVRVVPVWSDSPWAGGVRQVARMVYEDRVWAVVGSIDGAATHLAEQVVAKALVTLVSPGSTDKTVSFAGVPWSFTLLPGDDVQAEALARHLAAQADAAPIALVSTTDHDGRAAAAEMRAALARARLGLPAEIPCAAGAADLEPLVVHLLAVRPRTAIVLAPPADAGRLASRLRAAGWTGRLVGGSSLARRGFRESAGAAAEGAVFPLLHDPARASWRRFARSVDARFGRAADFTAGAAYDAVTLTIEAARRGGLNRARLRDAVRALAPFDGVTGEIRFDSLGRNARPVGLGSVRAGRLVVLPGASR